MFISRNISFYWTKWVSPDLIIKFINNLTGCIYFTLFWMKFGSTLSVCLSIIITQFETYMTGFQSSGPFFTFQILEPRTSLGVIALPLWHYDIRPITYLIRLVCTRFRPTENGKEHLNYLPSRQQSKWPGLKWANICL